MDKQAKKEIIQKFRNNILLAGTEAARKELLQGMLDKLFGSYEDTEKILDEMRAGAEKRVIISSKQRSYGRQDTQYANIIIEFERDFKKTGAHAKEQLHEYVFGNIKKTGSHDYVLIATDCIHWQLYSPHLVKSATDSTLEKKDITLKNGERFILAKDNAEDFYYFLDRHIFGVSKTKATLHSIQIGFGELSYTFTSCLSDLQAHYETIKDKGHIKVAYEEWQRFLSISYGSTFQGGAYRFLVHSYLSMLVKLIAYEVLAQDTNASQQKLRAVLQGTAFGDLQVENLVERDFFYWAGTKEHFSAVLPALRRIQRELWGYDFSDVREDILKGIYQELIDEDTRHELGEFYTPDWLCERMIKHFAPQQGERAIDPSCGSGSFLRAWVQYLREKHDMGAQELLNSIVGIDIHPLAMQIAKVTLILSLSELIKKAPRHVRLPVYLANTLYIPEGAADIFKEQYKISINKKGILLSEGLFKDLNRFSLAIEACDKISGKSMGQQLPKEDVKQALINSIQAEEDKYKGDPLDDELIDNLYHLYEELKLAKDTGRDSLWRFIIEHVCRPVFLKEDKFDYVVGNPPWLTYRGIVNAEYQAIIKKLALDLKVVPNPKNVANLEMGVVFLAYTSFSFLRPKGKVGFVLPRSLLSADQHENTRKRSIKGFELEEIWDLDEVKGLFNIPACVLFGVQAKGDKNIPYIDPLQGRSFSARIPEDMHDADLSQIKPRLQERETQWYYSRLGRYSAFSEQDSGAVGENGYHEHFRRGADMFPRSFYFIKSQIPEKGLMKMDKVPVITDPVQLQEAKPPWNKIDLIGHIEPAYFFRTALAKNIFPFARHGTILVTLPIEIKQKDNVKDISPKLLSVKELTIKGSLEAMTWFAQVEEHWEKNKSQLNVEKKVNFLQYLNWQNKLTQQQLHKPFLVLYNTSAKDANAVVLRRSEFDLPFIADTSTYAYHTNNEAEAYYLAAFLNANYPNRIIKDFQARGLFGPRSVHKKILSVPLPRYDRARKSHQALVSLSRRCAQKAAEYLKHEAPPPESTSGPTVGRLRKNLRDNILHQELIEIDKVLKEIIQKK